MSIEITLKNTAKFYEYLKKKASLADDIEFSVQVEYFDELCTRDSVSDYELYFLLDVITFWRYWRDEPDAIELFVSMVKELIPYVHLLFMYSESAKIKKEG